MEPHLVSLKESVKNMFNLTEEQFINLCSKYVGSHTSSQEKHEHFHKHVDVVAHADVHDADMPHKSNAAVGDLGNTSVASYVQPESIMTESVKGDVHVHNIIKDLGAGGGHTGGMGGIGAIGGGVLGGLLTRMLGGGLDGGRETVTPGMLTTAINGVNDNVQNTAVMSKLGAIEAAIPYNEAQVQLALAQLQSALTLTSTVNQTATIQGQFGLKDAITTYGLANLTATKDAAFANQTAISASTKEILAAINGNEIANLNRQLTVAESRGLEDRVNSRIGNTTVEVTQNVNQQQMQQQQQQQLNTLACAVNGLVTSHQNLQQGIVNLGTMVGNTQSAANTRVN